MPLVCRTGSLFPSYLSRHQVHCAFLHSVYVQLVRVGSAGNKPMGRWFAAGGPQRHAETRALSASVSG